MDYFRSVLHESGKWVLTFESDKGTIFYRNKAGQINFFDSEDEAIEHLETFEILTIYGDRLKNPGNPLSGQEMVDAAMKKLSELKEDDF